MNTLRRLAVVIVVLLSSMAANADPVLWEFSGTVNNESAFAEFTYGSLELPTWSLTVGFDDDAEPLYGDGIISALYGGILTFAEVTIGDLVFSGQPIDRLIDVTINDNWLGSDGYVDDLISLTVLLPEQNGFTAYPGRDGISFYFLLKDQHASHVLLPDGVNGVGLDTFSRIDLAKFPPDSTGPEKSQNSFGALGQFDGLNQQASGRVTGVVGGSVSVPEPGTLALLMLGLLGIGLTRKRRTIQ